MPVEIQNDAGLSETGVIVDDALFEDLLKLVARRLNDPRLAREVCVRICDEAESRQLNATYRQIDKSTNVLSFAADVDLPEAPLGDLAICLPVVVREAAAQHKAAQDHLAHLFVHGVLHLLGYDHADDDQAQAMEMLEVEILAAAGVADPYRAID